MGAVNPLWAAHYLTGDVELLHFIAQAGGHLLHVLLPLNPFGRQHLGDFPVALFVQVAKGQVVQTPLDLPDTQPVGQRGVYIQGFLGDPPALVLGQGVQGLHIM